MTTFSRLGKLGRLGNQLFQVAATLATAEKFGEEAIFPHWQYAKYFAGPFNQSLDDAAISQAYFEPEAKFNPIPYEKNVDLYGFFQSEKYFSDYKELIRQKYRFREDLLPPEWQNVSADCSIHVRRGDYLNEAHLYVPLQMDYYKRAIKIMKARGCKSFLVFTDNVEWCKKQFPQDMTVVERLSDIQSLCLMSRCKNHIIANSTFSWWSSWLCDNPSKMILAPQVWYGFRLSIRKNTDYQYCSNWELLPHSLSLQAQLRSWFRAKRKETVYKPVLSRRNWLKTAYNTDKAKIAR